MCIRDRINAGDEIPKYGNYFIADNQSDCIFGSEWTIENTVKFYTNKLDSDLIQYYMVKDRPKIEYDIKIDEEILRGKSKWLKKAADNK